MFPRSMIDITLILAVFLLIGIAGVAVRIALAGAPSGADTFQLLASPTTGGDNTGDGGTGNADDFNYYYVGQQFTTTFEIKSGGTTAANIWVDYATATSSADNLQIGTFFNTWSGQTITTTAANSFGGSRVLSTGSNIPTSQSSGTGNFGSVRWTMVHPTATSLATSSAALLDINIGTIGDTTESNISLSGVDLLDDAEDFNFHIWADVTKPFAESPSPANGATNVAVTDNYTFDLRDTKNGEGNNTGVGTGVNTSEPPGVITFNGTSETDDSSFSCSGTWGTNLCAVTVNPDPPSGISGDTRNFAYNTAFTVNISGFQDLGSSSQSQLGEANGPNTMDAKQFTFTTEPDIVKPQVTSETPTRSSSNVAVDTNITVEVQDRKTYPSGPSGTGITSNTCRINVSSPSVALVTYKQGDATVTTNTVDYGFQFIINPASDFAQNETVTVSVFDCADQVSNVMVTDTYTFGTIDATAPFVDEENPADDGTVAINGVITFHIKDTGVGVSLASTVVYVNGSYYANASSSGQVTTQDTRITFATSVNFNGGNYAGDTTGVSGTAADYTFTIDPEADFTAGESVPVLIYSTDTSGNLMEREVVGIVAQVDGSTFCGANTTFNGSQCTVDGSIFCGSGTTFNGSQCVSTVSDSGGGGGGGGAGGGAITGVIFSGRAYPLSRINLLRDGVIAVSTLAGPDAKFFISIAGISPGSYTFSVTGQDSNGIQSKALSFPLTLTTGVSTRIGGLFLAPTLAVDKKEVRQGDNIAIFGQTSPESTVTIVVSSSHEHFRQTAADDNGVFLYNFDTAPLERGSHETKAKAATEGEISEFGHTVAFRVGDQNIENVDFGCPARGDLNDDCRVNLVDFSIAVFWYENTLSELFRATETAKLNGDGVVDLVDFSIMAFYWTG